MVNARLPTRGPTNQIARTALGSCGCSDGGNHPRLCPGYGSRRPPAAITDRLYGRSTGADQKFDLFLTKGNSGRRGEGDSGCIGRAVGLGVA